VLQKLLVLWLTLVACVSLSPWRVKEVLGTMGRFHNLGHFFVFLLTGAMILAGAPASTSRVRRLAFIILFSAATEGLESFIYFNKFEWTDFFIDCAAIAISPLVLLACRFVASS
jgi:hypothetical protein